ncbi:MAG: sodium/solute symporter [FCB group bacterium]|jgi:SSS family solute:Na+ symporter|nr:sodium/solute symporter [FCB group bacterium]
MTFTFLDIAIFCAYFLGTVLFGVIVTARSKTKSSSDFFLASKKLPWYVVGASFVASNISTEHFIGMVGWGFLYGMAVANWEWGNAVTFSVLIWIFLPFYMRGNVSTMPEFLERRFSAHCRYIYAAVMIVGLVIAMLGGVLFAGAKALNVFVPAMPLEVAVVVLAVAAGTYTVYGGLLSAVWADFLQYCLLMIGGIVVTIFGLYYAGGYSELARAMPEKFIMLYPSTHPVIPWTGVASMLLSVGIWYSCANQFMVQRCLGARSEWDARMGVVMAGFSKAILPFLVVVPGIIAFYLFQDRISDGDQSWPFLVRTFIPSGLAGLVLAGLASAIMSTLSAITNSSATIFTLDLYKPLLRPGAGDRELHRVGRLSSAAIMLVGVLVALVLVRNPGVTVFGVIQTTFFYIAPPIAATFLIGILWRRATTAGAITTLVLGFALYLPLTKYVLFPYIPWLKPYDNFMHHTFVIYLLSGITLIVVSLFTKPEPAERLAGVIWSRSALGVREEEKGRHRGLSSLGLWWAVMVALIAGLYVWTNSRGSHTEWLEAENLAYSVTGKGTANVQERGTLPDFNLWTGKGQVLFKPDSDNAAIAFSVPVPEQGQYEIDLVITRGPEYGAFRVLVNDKPASMRVMTTARSGKRGIQTTWTDTEVYDSRRSSKGSADDASGLDNIAGAHVVQRLRLGDFALDGGKATLSFVPVKGEGDIGIDQVILTK